MASARALYDDIGHGYAQYRRPDPRIAAYIQQALGAGNSIVNVGAGTGSYEPADRSVIAVEPAITMIRQRPSAAAPVVQASVSALPCRDRSFDAALGILTPHHWPDWRAGLREMARAARRVVLLTWDPWASSSAFWLTDEYFPEIPRIDRAIFPTMDELRRELGPISVTAVPIPHDCTDGFLCAYWRRPRAYLEPPVRAAISTFAKLDAVEPALQQLAADLDSGAWQRRHGALLDRESVDFGYRVVASLST